MTENERERGAREIESPAGMVVGAVEPKSAEAVKEALVAAGFAADAIDGITAEDLAANEAPFEQDGVRGAVQRFLSSLGGELDHLGELERIAADGHVLIGVPVDNDERMRRAGEVLREHGAHEVTHFGRWTITTL